LIFFIKNKNYVPILNEQMENRPCAFRWLAIIGSFLTFATDQAKCPL